MGLAVMVAKVYGRFAPRSDERDRWEKMPRRRTKKSIETGTVVGTPLAPPNNEKSAEAVGSARFGE